MKHWLLVLLLASSTISASARPLPPHRINKVGSKDSELNDPVAQGTFTLIAYLGFTNVPLAAVGNTDGERSTYFLVITFRWIYTHLSFTRSRVHHRGCGNQVLRPQINPYPPIIIKSHSR